MTFRKFMVLTIMLVASIALPAQASPGGGLGALERPTTAASLLTPVHGCHRSAQDSMDGWHRHVGGSCRAIRSGPGERNPYAQCRTRCQYVGPIKQCRQVCR